MSGSIRKLMAAKEREDKLDKSTKYIHITITPHKDGTGCSIKSNNITGEEASAAIASIAMNIANGNPITASLLLANISLEVLKYER